MKCNIFTHSTDCTCEGYDLDRDDVDRIVTRIFHGDAPRCECCGERDTQCRWRPAYQMMLCPNCPPKGLPRP
jgi:hypothetical protein